MSDLPDGLLLRALSSADAAEFRRHRLDGLERHPEAFGESLADATARDDAGYAARIAAMVPPDLILGAFAGDRLVGCTGFRVRPGAKKCHKGEAWGVYVAPEYRGRRVGAALMQAIIAHARQHVAALHLGVVAENAAAQALYRSLGFAQYGCEPDALRVDGRSHDEDLLRLALAPA